MLLLTIWGTGGKEAMGKLEIVSSPCHPHMDVSIHAQTCVWACAHVWSHIEMSQAGSLGSCHTPAETGLDCRLYHVWARARQSFSGSAKDSSDFSGFGFRMGNNQTQSRKTRGSERVIQINHPFFKFAVLKGDPEWRAVVHRMSILWREEIRLAEPLSGLQAGPPPSTFCGLWAAHVDSPGAEFGGCGTIRPDKGLLLSSLWTVTMCSGWGWTLLASPTQPRNTAKPVPGPCHPFHLAAADKRQAPKLELRMKTKAHLRGGIWVQWYRSFVKCSLWWTCLEKSGKKNKHQVCALKVLVLRKQKPPPNGKDAWVPGVKADLYYRG